MAQKRRGRSKKGPQISEKARLVLLTVAAMAAVLITLNETMGWGLLPTWSEIRTAFSGEPAPAAAVPVAQGETQVHVIDVGQGDCILLKQGEHWALIDAGEREQAETVLAYLRAQGVERLDYAVVSHMHTDHMGAMQAVLEQVPADMVLLPEMELAPTPTARSVENLLLALDEGNCQVEVAERGREYPLGSAVLRVVSNGIKSDDQNNDSVGLLFSGGGFSFLATGDGEKKYEKELLGSGEVRGVDVFKAAHHGSDTSNTEELLTALRPRYVAVSCGAGNDYGHPHKEPMERFTAVGAQIFRTDQAGSIVFSSVEGGGIEVLTGRDS